MPFQNFIRNLIFLLSVMIGFLEQLLPVKTNKKTIKNMVFISEQPVDVFGIKDWFFKGKILDSTVNIVIRMIRGANNPESNDSKQDLNQTLFLQKVKTPYILEILTHTIKNGCLYFGYEFYDCTLRKYFELNKNVEEGTFKRLLYSIISRAGSLHKNGITLNNISPDYIAIENVNNAPVAKFMNLSKCVLRNSKNYSKDIKDLGYMLISLAVGEKYFIKTIEEISGFDTYEGKHNFILQVFKNIKWIPSHKMKLFSDLIICLIEAKSNCANALHQFQKHPFFWNDHKIQVFIAVINSRLDLNDKLKDKEVIRKRIESINRKLTYNWIIMLDEKVKKLVPTTSTDNISDLIKFIRNRLFHQTDDTDDETKQGKHLLYKGVDKECSMPKRIILNQNAIELSEFFDTQKGVINYFVTTYVDLHYDLFEYYRQYFSTHRKLKKYYPTCFMVNDKKSLSDEADNDLQLQRRNSQSVETTPKNFIKTADQLELDQNHNISSSSLENVNIPLNLIENQTLQVPNENDVQKAISTVQHTAELPTKMNCQNVIKLPEELTEKPEKSLSLINKEQNDNNLENSSKKTEKRSKRRKYKKIDLTNLN